MTVTSGTAVLDRLAALGLALPERCDPRGRFLPWKRVGPLVFLAGQICEWNGNVPHRGQVGIDLDLETATHAAQICALNLLFHLAAAAGGLDRVAGCVRVGAFVNAPAGFPASPQVANGASDLFIALWGEAGRHARMAVGVSALPMNAAVEVDAIFELQP